VIYQPAVSKLILNIESTLGPMLQHCHLPFRWCAHMAPQKQCCYYFACWFIVFSRISSFLLSNIVVSLIATDLHDWDVIQMVYHTMKERGTGQARPGSCFCRSKGATGMTMMEIKN